MPQARAKKKAAERWSLPATQERSRATRERLLEAAESVFAAKGYDGAKISDIAEEAGVSVGAVYFRFKDKSALFSAIAESFADEARQGLSRLLQNTEVDDDETVIHAFVMGTAANFGRHKGMFRAIVERGFERAEAMDRIFAVRDELAAALEKALKVRRNDLVVRVMTQMIYGFLVSGILNKRAPTSFYNYQALAELSNACIAYFHEATK